jgi:hypothetical protein
LRQNNSCDTNLFRVQTLTKLTPEQKDDLILELWAMVQAQAAQIAVLVAENEALKKRVAELEERLNEPRKTPSNSSLPPSTGFKPTKIKAAARLNEPADGKAASGAKGVVAFWRTILTKPSLPRPNAAAIARRS